MANFVIGKNYNDPRFAGSEMLGQCRNYADGVVNNGDDIYALEQRGCQSSSNYFNDHLRGKIAECWVEKYLREDLGISVSQPDFNIYPKGEKNWSSDLHFMLGGLRVNCGVKACGLKTLRTTGGVWSWTFQLSNKSGYGGRDSFLDSEQPNDLMFFTYVPELSGRWCYILACVSADVLNGSGIYRDPVKDYLKGRKLCVYSQDLMRICEIQEKPGK